MLKTLRRSLLALLAVFPLMAVAMPSGEMRLASPPILLQKLGIPS